MSEYTEKDTLTENEEKNTPAILSMNKDDLNEQVNYGPYETPKDSETEEDTSMPRLRAKHVFGIAVILLLVAILITSTLIFDHVKRISTKKESVTEIKITEENFEKFYTIEFYNTPIITNEGYYSSRNTYDTELVAVIEPKQVPGKFKLTSVKLKITQEPKPSADYDEKQWKMKYSPVIDGSATETFYSIEFKTKALDLPQSGAKIIEFPMHTDNAYGGVYLYDVSYEIIDVKGYYVPHENENTDSYKVKE